MNEAEKITILEEIFEADPGSIDKSTPLSQVNYDSMAVLALIVMLKEKFEKTISGESFRNFKMVGDLLELMRK